MRRRVPCLFPLVLAFLALAGGTQVWGMAGTGSVPQSPLLLAAVMPDRNLLASEEQQVLFAAFRERFFSPWAQTGPRQSREDLESIFVRFGNEEVYGENLQPRHAAWAEGLRQNSRIRALGELGRKAAAVRPTVLRLMPTESPLFRSSGIPGEGYPFDLLQNSLVHPGEPLFVSHLSEDGLWAWVDTSSASGWVPVPDFAWVDDRTAARWSALPLAAVTRENGVFRSGGTSLFRAKIGTVLPMIRRGIGTHVLLVPSRKQDGSLAEAPVRISADDACPMPLRATPWTVASLAEQCMGEPYGWGGFLGNRDCSATTGDLLRPLGIWLPRNSGAQAGAGKSVSLKDLSPEEKKRLIMEEGIPFLTLLWLPGHVMLYAGPWKGEPLVLHNLWGIRTENLGKEGRFIVGKCVVSTLDLGSDLPGHIPGKLIIHRLERMVFPGDIHGDAPLQH